MIKFGNVTEELQEQTIEQAFIVLEKLEEIGNAVKPKIKLLKDNKDNPVLYAMFKWAYDPVLNFYIKPEQQIDCIKTTNYIFNYNQFQSIIENLSNRHITGNDAKDLVGYFLSFCTFTESKWYHRILNRDLRIGITLTNAAKIWPEIKGNFGVQAAKEANFKKIKYPVYVEPKIDGERQVNIGEKMTQRSGKDYTPLLKFIPECLQRHTNKIIDGEFFAHWEADNPADAEWEGPWNKTASFLSRGRKAGGWTEEAVSQLDPVWYNRVVTEGMFWVFDCIDPETYENGTDDTPFVERRLELTEIIDALFQELIDLHVKKANAGDEESNKLLEKIQPLLEQSCNLLEGIPNNLKPLSEEVRINWIKNLYKAHKLGYEITRLLQCPIYLVPQFLCFSEQEIKEVYKLCIEDGFEGVMIKDPESHYLPNEKRRDFRWMKWKPWETLDVEIVGYIEGKGRLAGMLGAFEVKLPNGEITKAAGQMTDEFRLWAWENRESLIGEFCEVKQQQDANAVTRKLRFPIFLRLREDK